MALAEYYYAVSFQEKGDLKTLIIKSRSPSDEGAIFAAHAIADALEFCGRDDIKIDIRGAAAREVGFVSDQIGGDQAYGGRQHVHGSDYRSASCSCP